MYVPKRKPDEDPTPRLPIPTQVISNGEYLPEPQTAEQRKVEALVAELADARARKLGVKRRDFLRTAAGTATVLYAMNQVYGCGGGGGSGGGGGGGGGAFDVCAEDTMDPARARERFQSDFFVMDVQTHHVDKTGAWYPGAKDTVANLRFTDLEGCAGNDSECKLNLVTREHYIQEMFLESETAIAVMSGIPPGAGGILPNTTMAATRDEVNHLANSQRMLAQMLIEPTLSEARGQVTRTSIYDIERNVQELGSVAIKAYPGGDVWWLDDEQVAYPMYERALNAGIKVIAVHKGFPQLFGPQAAERVQSIDIPKAARDWPDLNFVIYHSGYFPGDTRLADGTLVPGGVEQFASVLEANPDIDNVYAEIGSTFAIAIANGGVAGMEILGRLLKRLGPDRICWGTDSLWWGSPQWQIDAFKTFQISEQLQAEKGYPAIDDDTRRKILGLNSARLYGVDVEAVRCTVANDAVAQARAELQAGAPRPVSQPSGPRTRRDFMRLYALEEAVERIRHGNG
ncbi:MAG TPA: amidohydrolase family protein [Candidatus Binatia bacterium]|nr:amidohydrolase family protein [Candidatus Binatia bacterium]